MSNVDLRIGLADIASQARPVDLYGRALARSRQLRRRRTAGAALAAAVAVLAVVGLTSQVLGGSNAAPGPVAPVTPTASPSPEPTDIPTDPPAVLTPLSNATLTFPDWPVVREEIGLGTCPTGPVTFVNNFVEETGTGTSLHVGPVLSVQVAGEAHLVATVSCGGPGQGSAEQVIAYRADGAGFTVVDKVVDSTVTPAEGALAYITGLTAGPAPGSVVVEHMLGLTIGTGHATYGMLSQHRTYTWDGSDYERTAGPASFLADPTAVDVSVTASELVFGPPVEFCRTGTITLTVANNGSTAVGDVALALMLPGLGEGTVNAFACSGVPDGQGIDSALVPVGLVMAGANRTVTATVVVDTRREADYGPGVGRFEGGLPEMTYADVRVGEQRTGTTVRLTVRY